MSSDPFSNFTCLDELTQVIYQSIYKFVVISTVSSSEWKIHLGLFGSEGRWWQGSWSEDDVHRTFGSKSSDKLLESFAEKLAEAFVKGEISITDWATDKGANIKFTLGSASKKPMHVPLVEMSLEDAAAHATSVFLDIALQAQSRNCRLYPSTTEYAPIPSLPSQQNPLLQASSKRHDPGDALEHKGEPATSRSEMHQPSNKSDTQLNVEAAQEEIKALKSQLHKQSRTVSPPQKSNVPAVRPHKGGSLANPNKKARKYQAIEFASDEE